MHLVFLMLQDPENIQRFWKRLERAVTFEKVGVNTALRSEKLKPQRNYGNLCLLTESLVKEQVDKRKHRNI